MNRRHPRDKAKHDQAPRDRAKANDVEAKHGDTCEGCVNRRGQVSLPPVIREWLGLRVGGTLVFRRLHDGTVTLRAQGRRAHVVKPAATEGPFMEDPMRLLSAGKLGQALGWDVKTAAPQVRALEASGRLVSVGLSRSLVTSDPGPERGYPVFQAWPGVAGRPIEAVLDALKVLTHGGAVACGFLALPNDLLGGLTPVEMLVGRRSVPTDLESGVLEVLQAPAEQRLAWVVAAAKADVAVIEQW